MLRRQWFDPDDPSRIKPEAFFRRRIKDDDGLSLLKADCVTPDQCMQQFRQCYGVISLHAGRLKDLGLIVVDDEQDAHKALVVNLPFENPATAEAEKLIGDVARSARIMLRAV